jgi:hypothetical protein
MDDAVEETTGWFGFVGGAAQKKPTAPLSAPSPAGPPTPFTAASLK